MAGERIMIVEDEELVARVIDNRLKSLGFSVAGIFSSGEEAIQQVETLQTDLILMDIKLQGKLDGIETAEQIQSKLDIPVIFLTAYTDPAILQRAKLTGPFGYLLKPIETDQLRNTIEMALYKHSLEEKLKQSEANYRAIVEDQSEIINRYRIDGTITYVNEAYCRLYNKKREELIGNKHTSFLGKTDLEQMEKTRARLTPENPLIVQEYRYVKPDGEVIWLQWSDRLICDEQGEPVEYQGVGRDVTELKRIEEALRRANEGLSKSIDSLQNYNRQVTLLNEMGNLLQSCLTVEDAYDVVGEYAEKLFPDQNGALYVFNKTRDVFEMVADWGKMPPEEKVVTNKACWALRRGQVHVVSMPNTRLYCRHTGGTQSADKFRPYICVPMLIQAETLGLMHLVSSVGQDIEVWKPLAITVAERAGWAVLNLNLREKLREQSIRDPLTNLYNRRHLEETLELEISRSSRHQRSFVVVMLDMDYLKAFNDKFGHDAGDALLQEFGRFLVANIRKEDIACRYGGDEFVIIMPEALLEDATRRIETLQRGSADLKIDFTGRTLPGITASSGLACYPQHGLSADELLKAADEALYHAKALGRNKMAVAKNPANDTQGE